MKKLTALARFNYYIYLFTQQRGGTTGCRKIIEIGTTDNQTMNHLDILTNRGSEGW
ncbi:MAG: hypothetical protein R2744_03205 [Bacteroidales bacterium]